MYCPKCTESCKNVGKSGSGCTEAQLISTSDITSYSTLCNDVFGMVTGNPGLPFTQGDTQLWCYMDGASASTATRQCTLVHEADVINLEGITNATPNFICYGLIPPPPPPTPPPTPPPRVACGPSGLTCAVGFTCRKGLEQGCSSANAYCCALFY